MVDDPQWRRAQRATDATWFVVAEDSARIDRLVARHIEFGKTPDEARTWVANIDERNSELVSSTSARADRVIVNGAAVGASPSELARDRFTTMSGCQSTK